MDDQIEDAINETKAVLQPLFSKPKLSTKLLSKPPFRFIHDIVTATLDSTGFPEGLFENNELQSSSYKDDKSAKLAFLDKLIHLVNAGGGSTLEASSSKIVAGLEPLNTNILLTAFGRLALDGDVDRSALIQHCRDGLGIEEFKQRDCSNLAAAAPPDAAESQEVNIEEFIEPQPTKEDAPSLADQMKACNEDMGQTIQMISHIVSKPKCSEKLLSKPPFRYLHDIFTAIAVESGFDLGQVFSDEEMNSSNITEKQAKLEFLDKLISFLSNVTGTSIDVKPTKIVAGLEPERTRYLLQVYTVVSTSKEVRVVTPANNGSPVAANVPVEMDIDKMYSEDILQPESVQTNQQLDGAVGGTEISPSVVANGILEPKQIAAPESPPKTEGEADEEVEAQGTVEKLPDFESWLENGGPKVMEGTKSSCSDIQLRINPAISHPITSLMLPSKLSAADLETISASVHGITELTTSLGQLMGMFAADMDSLRQ